MSEESNENRSMYIWMIVLVIGALAWTIYANLRHPAHPATTQPAVQSSATEPGK